MLNSLGLYSCGTSYGGLMAEDFDGDRVRDLLVVGSLSACTSSCSGGSTSMLMRGGYSGNPFRFAVPEVGVLGLSLSQVSYLRLAPDAPFSVVGMRTDAYLLLEGQGNGTFVDSSANVLPQGLMVPNFASTSAVGDVNGDGYDDLYLSDGKSTVDAALHSALLLNARNRTFVNSTLELFDAVTDVPRGAQHSPLLLDFNGDDRVDICVLQLAVYVFEAEMLVQRANGTFGKLAFAETGFVPMNSRGFAAADFDKDGDLDIVNGGFTGANNPQVRRYDNLGNATFVVSVPSELVLYPEDTTFRSALAHDFDHDGHMDLVFSHYDYVVRDNNVTIAYGTPGGAFERVRTLMTEVSDVRFAAYDLGSRSFLIGAGKPNPQETLQPTVYSSIIDGANMFPQGGTVFASYDGFTSLLSSSIVLEDYSGDGCVDMAACGRSPRFRSTFECMLLAGTCDGAFVASVTELAPLAYASMFAYDFDLDGVVDLLYWGAVDPNDFWTPNKAAYHLTSRGFALDVGAEVDAVIAIGQGGTILSCDVNDDGAEDIMTYYWDQQTFPEEYRVAFLVNLGNGSFTNVGESPVVGTLNYTMSLYLYASRWGDLSNEGRDSLLWLTNYEECVYVNLGNGSIKCDDAVLPASRPAYSTYVATLISDFDGDDKQDLLTIGCHYSTGEDFTMLAFGTANHTLMAAPRSAVATPVLKTYPVTAINLDKAGGMDVVMLAAVWPSRIYSYMGLLGLATRQLNVTEAFTPGTRSVGSKFTVGDIDGDGWDDMVVSDTNGDTCEPPGVMLRAPESDASSTSGSGSANVDSSDDDSSLVAIIAGAVGGAGALLLALVAVTGCIVLCCGCCLVVAVLAVLCIVVAAVAVVVLVIVAVGVAGGGGGGAAVVLVRGRGGGSHRVHEELVAVDLDDVRRRMRDTTEYRRIAWGELQFGRKIGEGAFGAVFAGLWQGVKVAIKVLKSESLTLDNLQEFAHEALLMTKVSYHPHILTFVGAVIEDEHLALVTHLAEHGSLDKALEKGALSDEDKWRVAMECASGVAFLHELGIVHRDLAARNVLLDAGDHAQIADFGYSRVLQHGADAQNTKSDVGPIRWMSPEAISSREYSAASDAWAFGMLLYEIYHDGRVPFHDLASLADVAIAVSKDARTPEVNAQVNPEISALMMQLWAFQPRDRPTMGRVCRILSNDSSFDSPLDHSSTSLSMSSSTYDAFHCDTMHSTAIS